MNPEGLAIEEEVWRASAAATARREAVTGTALANGE
jgi:hypothetical protein